MGIATALMPQFMQEAVVLGDTPRENEMLQDVFTYIRGMGIEPFGLSIDFEGSFQDIINEVLDIVTQREASSTWLRGLNDYIQARNTGDKNDITLEAFESAIQRQRERNITNLDSIFSRGETINFSAMRADSRVQTQWQMLINDDFSALENPYAVGTQEHTEFNMGAQQYAIIASANGSNEELTRNAQDTYEDLSPAGQQGFQSAHTLSIETAATFQPQANIQALPTAEPAPTEQHPGAFGL